MQDEELFVGIYIIRRREHDDKFTIESAVSGDVICVPEKRLAIKISELWKEPRT